MRDRRSQGCCSCLGRLPCFAFLAAKPPQKRLPRKLSMDGEFPDEESDVTPTVSAKTEIEEMIERGASQEEFWEFFKRGGSPRDGVSGSGNIISLAFQSGNATLGSWLSDIMFDFDSAKADLASVLAGPSKKEDTATWLERLSTILDLVCCRYPHLILDEEEDPVLKILSVTLPNAPKFEALYALKRAGVSNVWEHDMDEFVDLVFNHEPLSPDNDADWEDVASMGESAGSPLTLVVHKPTGVEFLRRGPLPASSTVPPEVLAKEECLAAELYLQFGAVVPLTRYGLVEADGETNWFVFSHRFTSLTDQAIDFAEGGLRPTQLFEGFVADCILGADYSGNLESSKMSLTKESMAVRINPGGALFFKSLSGPQLQQMQSDLESPAEKHETDVHQLSSYRKDSGVFQRFPAESEDIILTYAAERCTSAQTEVLQRLCETLYEGHGLLEKSRQTFQRALLHRLNWLNSKFWKGRARPTYKQLKEASDERQIRVGAASDPSNSFRMEDVGNRTSSRVQWLLA